MSTNTVPMAKVGGKGAKNTKKYKAQNKQPGNKS